MDIFDEVTKEVERDRTKALFTKYRTHLTVFLAAIILLVSGSLIYRNYKLSLIAESYQEYANNSVSGYTEDIILDSNPNAIDVIHFITKYSFLASSGEHQAATDLLNSSNYNVVSYQPFREILYLYDDNREGSVDNQIKQVFKSESLFITAINQIETGDLEAAFVSFNTLSEDPNIPEILRNKIEEFKKIIKFKLSEQKA